MTERIGDLSLEDAAPAGRPRSRSVLFVHGMWGGSWYFRNYLYGAAQAGWDAWALDLRGHGLSPAPDGLGSVSLADYVADVRHCLDQLGEAVLVGHSMGGLIAQKAAEGTGVAAAIFLTSAPPRGINAPNWPVVSRMARYVPAMLGARAFTAGRAHADFLFLNGLTRGPGPHHARRAPAPHRGALPRPVPGSHRPRPHAHAGGGLGAAVQGRAGVDGAGTR